jgi:hypothetical protein
MKFNVTLIDSESSIRNSILEAMKNQLNKALNTTAASIKSDLAPIIKNSLETEPEFNSLMSGQLRQEFGIQNTSSVTNIIDIMVNSIVVNIKPVKISNRGLSGGLEIQLIGPGYGGALLDSSAQVIDNERGYSLPWLEWLLLKGNQILIRQYEVKIGPTPKSRSGDAIMIPSNQNWRVPPEFAGTERDNWVIRALNKVDNKITNIIQSKFESSL